MENNFEEFEEGPVESTAKRVHVTLNRRGNLFLNRYAIEAMGEPDAVTLMYDKRRKAIGLTRASVSKANAFVLKKKDRERSSGRLLYAANFCRRHSIKLTKTLAFTGAKVKDGILILDLHEVAKVSRQ